MATITEDFVSFETAKLLKEKGFDEKCFALYNPDGTFIQSGIRLNNIQVGRVEGSYSAPTLQMAMKWLREVHNWNIFINKSNTIYGYDANIESLVANHIVEVGFEKTYEDACEAAIKYCLEYLI